jgi:hypothetical protein
VDTVKSARIWTGLALLWLALLVTTNIYRAATQAITTDEAFSYHLFIAPKTLALFNTFDANYHVLHTLLCFVSVKAFGLSELSLRLPSLLACVLYYAAVCRIARQLFKVSPLFLLAVILLTVNPLMLDHMSIARGYGMALALFAWAFSEALSYQASPRKDRVLVRASVLLGLSVAANLTFFFPAAALFVILSAMAVGSGERIWNVVDRLLLPGAVCAFLLLVLPLSNLRAGSLYLGSHNLPEMVTTLLGASLRYQTCDFVGGAGCSWPPLTSAGYLAAQILFWASLGVTLLCVYRRREAGFIVAGTFFLTVCFLIATHAFLAVPYPWVRTGLYLMFLAPVCLLAACRWLWSQPKAPYLAWSWTAGLVALVAVMASQFNVDYYLEWRFDESGREIVQRLRSMHSGTQPLRVLAKFPLDLPLEFYRDRDRLAWLQWSEQSPPRKGFDAYLFNPEDAHFVRELGLRTVYVAEGIGTMLAVP